MYRVGPREVQVRSRTAGPGSGVAGPQPLLVSAEPVPGSFIDTSQFEGAVRPVREGLPLCGRQESIVVSADLWPRPSPHPQHPGSGAVGGPKDCVLISDRTAISVPISRGY